MRTTSRALLCLLLIAGFYLTALALVVAMLAIAAALVAWRQGGGSTLAWVAIAGAGGLVLTLRRVGKAQKHVPHGVTITRDEAPELWSLVTDVAGAAQTRVPREIRLVPEVNAAVSEDARMLGLVPGTRRLYVGLPLLQALDVAQLRSVLAHELGHYSQGHTRLGPITYRGRQVVVGAASEVDGVSGWVLRGYGRLYLLASAAVSRRQEREADEVSVAVAGPTVAAEALREIEVLAAAWQFYLDRYVSDAWDAGLAPTSDAFFGGFQHLLAARGEELAQLRTQAPPSAQSRWDSHPSTASRIAAIAAMDAPEVPRDTRPASVLVPGSDVAATRLAEELVQFGDRERLAWDELTPRARAAANQHAADLVFRASGRLAGVARGTLGSVLAVVEAGRLDELLRALDVDPQTPPDDEGVTPAMTVWATVLRCALVASGVSRWEHRWEAVDPFVGDVTPAQVRELARLGAAGPAGATELRARLVDLGVDLDSVGAQSEADARGAAVVAGVANVAVDGEQYDVLVLTHGLVLVPCPKKYNQGRRRLRELTRSATPAEIAATHWFVSFEDISSGAVVKRFPVAVSFTLHDGTTMQLKTKLESEELTSGSSVTLQNLAKGYSTVPA